MSQITKEEELLLFVHTFNEFEAKILNALVNSKKVLLQFIAQSESFNEHLKDKNLQEINTTNILLICNKLRNKITEILDDEEMAEILLMDARDIIKE